MKTVNFNLDNNKIYTTYSKFNDQEDYYDRSSIDHVLYRKIFNRITDIELRDIYIQLDLYKLYQMPIHINSIKNTMYHVCNLSSSN